MRRRRHLVSFDPDHFASLGAGRPPDVVERFRAAYASRLWGGEETGSGPGSSLAQTEHLVRELPGLLERFEVGTLLDAPCGDLHWMQHVELGEIRYIGAELLPELVSENAERYAPLGWEFVTLDLTRDPLPEADLVLCRDCLVHLSFEDIDRVLANIRRSGARYLLATTFPDEQSNVDVVTGDWRPLNLELAPLDLGAPLDLLTEGCTEQDGAFSDKALGLWDISSGSSS